MPATAGQRVPTSMTSGPLGSLQVDGRPVADWRVEAPLPRLASAARQGITLRRGGPYRIDEVRRSIQNIYALGYVSDVRVEATETESGLDLTFVVLPAPHLGEIRFSGESPVGTATLREALRLRPGDRVDRQLVEQQAERMQLTLADRGYLQASVQGELSLREGGTRADVTFHLDPGSPTRLRSLEIEGDLGEVSRAEIQERLGLREGATYRPLDLEGGIEDLRHYLALRNYFHSRVEVTSPAFDPGANTFDLGLTVELGPRVELELTVEGRSLEELREMLPIWEESSVADWVLKATRRRILEDLQSRGYWRPLIIFNRQRDEAGRNVEVTFNVRPLSRAAVEQVVFEGNASISAAELQEVVQTRESRLFRSSRFRSRQWERDQAAVRSLYQRRGFREVQIVDAPVSLDSPGGGLRARMIIDEGPQTVVDGVRLVFASALERPELEPGEWRDQLQLANGGPFNPAALRDDEGRLRILLANAGYPRAAVRSSFEIDEETHRAQVVYTLFPGQRTRVGRVLVAGNVRTDDEVILRELELVPGSPYTYEGIVRSQSRLYRLGLFSRVEIAPARPDGIDEERTLVVRVEEGPRNRLSWGLGYDSEEGPRGLVTLGNDNLWGMGRQGTLSLRASFREQRGRLVLTEPYLFGRRLSTSAISFFESVKEEGFDVERLGATLQVTKRHSESLTSFGRYTFRQVRTFNLEVDPAELDLEDRSAIIGSFVYSLIRDTRPNPIDPRTGTYQTLDVELSSEAVGSEADFLKIFGRSQWYWPVGPAVVATSGRLGLAFPFAGDDDLPLPERLFTGGSSSLRAFGLNAAGPADANDNPLGGEVLLLGNVELRFPVRGNVGAVLFADVGNVFADLESVSFEGIREVAGIGVRYATPVGPVRVDWGHLLDPRPGEDPSRFFLSIGHTF